MSKFLTALFILFFLLVLPTPAEALYLEQQGLGDYKDYTFVINAHNDEPSPSEYIKDTSNIKISITAWKDGKQQPVFTSGGSFRIRLEQPNYQVKREIDPLKATLYTIGVNNNTSPSELKFSIMPKDPASYIAASGDIVPGTYDIRLWEYSSPEKPLTLFTGANAFAVNSPGGGSSARVVTLGDNNSICKDRVTEVKIENAEVGKDFNLYWRGDLLQWAWQGKAKERSFTVPILGPEGGLTKVVEQYELCLIEGSVRLPPGAQVFTCPNPLKFAPPVEGAACTSSSTATCKAVPDVTSNNTAKKQARITGENFPGKNFTINFSSFRGDLIDTKNPTSEPKRFPNINASSNGTVDVNTGELAPGIYSFNFYPQTGNFELDSQLVCSIPSFTIDDKVETGNTAAGGIDFKSIVCDPASTNAESRCANASGVACDTSTGRPLAQDEVNAGKKGNGVYTAIGCIPTDPGLLVGGALKYIMGFAGGAALLMMIFGSFQMMTSGGNAENIKKGREQFVSAVIGLLFIIFSVLLLQIIGVDILGLPGFKK